MNTILVEELLRLAKRIAAEGRPYSHDLYFQYYPKGHPQEGQQAAADLGGYACEYAPFQELGLRKYVITDQMSKRALYGEPRFGKNYVSIGALQMFFDMTYDQAIYVFSVTDTQIRRIGNMDCGQKIDYTLGGVISRLEQVLAGEIE